MGWRWNARMAKQHGGCSYYAGMQTYIKFVFHSLYCTVCKSYMLWFCSQLKIRHCVMPGLPGQAGYIPYAQRPNMLFIFVTARFKYNIVLASRLASSTTHKTRRYKYKRYVETLSIRYLVASANHSA